MSVVVTRKRTSKVRREQLDFLDRLMIDGNPERVDLVRGLLALDTNRREPWRGLRIVPPGSFLDHVVRLFERTTDFPLELPTFTAICYLVSWLLERNITLDVEGSQVQTDLYLVMLAESASGKTYTMSVLDEVVKVKKIELATSAAKFIENFAARNRGLLAIDEFAQHLNMINSQAYAEELRDYYLKIADNQPIARRTRGAETAVEDPAMVLFGATVASTFPDYVTETMLLDGFAQRILFVYGDADPERPPTMYPIYRTKRPECIANLKRSWSEIENLTIHRCYTLDPDAIRLFEAQFRVMFIEHAEIPASFYRRILWRAFRYALMYHILLLRPEPVIGSEALAWALRVCDIHLRDGRRLIDQYNLSELEKLVRKAEELSVRKGRTLTTRDLIAGIRGIGNAGRAAFVLRLMSKPRTDLMAA